MRPQALLAMGLDYASIREVKEDLIYCQGQGFRLDGTEANAPAYDDVIQAATGVGHVTSATSGTPRLLPTVMADKACGLMMAQAISAALFSRERTGRGCHIEIPMEESMIAFMLVEHGAGAIAVPESGTAMPAGYARILTPERRPQQTADGWVQMLPYLPQHYSEIFASSSDPADVAVDAERFKDRRSTIAHSDGLYKDLHRIARQRTTDEWLRLCHEKEIPASRVRSLDDLVAALPVAQHPHAGAYRVLPGMARFDGHDTHVRRPAPLIGADSDGAPWDPIDQPAVRRVAEPS